MLKELLLLFLFCIIGIFLCWSLAWDFGNRSFDNPPYIKMAFILGALSIAYRYISKKIFGDYDGT